MEFTCVADWIHTAAEQHARDCGSSREYTTG
jgi:hypothetical protein